jgi:hypothetical protein
MNLSYELKVKEIYDLLPLHVSHFHYIGPISNERINISNLMHGLCYIFIPIATFVCIDSIKDL